jgi:hypothetical protein
MLPFPRRGGKELYVSGSLSRLVKSVGEAYIVSDAETQSVKRSAELAQIS